MMDKERVLEALGRIDPELIEQMEVQKKRRLPRALRTGLIAACVCLALAGTVFAAELIAGNFRTMEFFSDVWIVEPSSNIGVSLHGYTLRGGAIEYLPAEKLSSEALAQAVKNGEPSTVYQTFQNLQEAQELYQISLRENDVLGELETAFCEAQIDSSSEGVTRIQFREKFSNINGTEGLNAQIFVTVLTELMDHENQEMWFSYGYPAGYEYEVDSCESGEMTAVVARVEYQGNDLSPANEQLYGRFCCSAHFILDGMIYRVLVSSQASLEQAQVLLNEILQAY